MRNRNGGLMMGNGRKERAAGEILRLGGVDYRLESVMGCGSSAIVYNAVYEDELNRDCVHRVLLKELFPYDPGGRIYRGEDGEICCLPEAEDHMDTCRRLFLRGNRVNLELLAQIPDEVSGNLNSYEAYGTYYSILSVHGGKTLEEILEENTHYSLREAAEWMIWILNGLECFHRYNILHLDISPDNILLLKGRALLIDFNSVWEMGERGEEEFFFSEKDGYTAPEVLLRRISQIGPASDLYSVCAVFFRILTGRRLGNEEILGRGPGKSLSQDLEIFAEEPLSAIWQTVRIVVKGLHVLSCKRWQSVRQMRLEFEELLRRIDGRGISHSAIWERSRREWKRFKQPRGFYLTRNLSVNASVMDASSCFRQLGEGKLFLLTGPGGIGKTSFLLEALERSIGNYHPGAPVVMYIPLVDYQQAGEEPRYIRKYILRGISCSGQTESLENAIHELDRLLSQERKDSGRYILLLDGLNEAGRKRRALLQEIEELGSKEGVGILVTDRADSVKVYGLRDFKTVSLLPLSQEQVCGELKKDGLPCPADDTVLELLCNPMMLTLYRKISAQGNGEVPENMENMVGRYLESLYIRQLRTDSGNQAEQLRQGYVLFFVLPSIVWEMKRRRRTILTFEELHQVVGISYHTLLKKEFSLSFPEYAGKSRLMLRGIANESEWYDYAVSEQLMERLNLLEKSESGYYRLIHDNFMDYLSKRAGENRRILGKYRKKVFSTRLAACLMAIGLLAAGGNVLYRMQGLQELSEEEKYNIRNAAQRLLINIQVLDTQIALQKGILQDAYSEGVLNRDAQELMYLRERIERALDQETRQGAVTTDGEKWIAELENQKTSIPLDTLGELYIKNREMSEVMEEALDYLERCLCDSDTPYWDRARREPLIKAYESYLDSYGEVCYLQLVQVTNKMESETERMVMDAIAGMSTFKQYVLKYPLSGVKEEELDRQLAASESQLEDARGELRQQNFPMTAVGW